MRKSRNKKSRPSLSKKARLRKKAQRRREVERLEDRQMLSVNFADDPLFQDQWHLKATGQLTEQPTSPTFLQSQARVDINVTGAWELGYTGAGVQVAVLDDAFDLNHPDLNFTLLTGENTFLDIRDLDNDPSYIDTIAAHGTAVAGLIGALDNAEGGLGVAPGVDLVPIRFLGPGTNNLTPTQNAQYEFLQFAGVPAPGDDGSNADQIVDVYNRSYGPSDQTRLAGAMTAEDLEALRVAATLGRGTWLDIDGDGVFEVEEIRSLGAINVHASGNGTGAPFNNPFPDQGAYDSSQYDQLSNSRYTISVGSVDFGGDYTNPETGSRGSFAETGANVLLVAPSQTLGIGIGTDTNLIGGLTTADLSGNNGEDGYNQAPVFGQEIDPANPSGPDFLVDTNYTSNFGGTSGAAPQVTGAIALMLEANPNLSRRDVEKILLMSAQQIDQFDESWIANPLRYFEDTYEIPQYVYSNFDTNADGTPDVRNGILPNYYDESLVRGFFRDFFGPNVDMDLPSTFGNNINGVVGVTGYTLPTDELGQPILDAPIYAYSPNASGGSLTPQGLRYLGNPISAQAKDIDSTTTNLGLSPLVNGELVMETETGFTVSWGYGDYLEEYGFAHGMLDTELAVKLAEAWETYDLYLDNEVTITSAIQNGFVRVQPKAEIDIPNSGAQFEVPGGLTGSGATNINNAHYAEFFKPISYSGLNVDGNNVGSVITNAPFYAPNGLPNNIANNNRGDSRLAIPIDPNIQEEFLSVEWLEFTAQVTGGDVDSLRISVVSPNGTQSELSPYRLPVDGGAEFFQEPQATQGNQVPNSNEVIDEQFGGFEIIADDGTSAFIDGDEDIQVNGINIEDPLAAGTPWTWTTNRHYAELFSTEAQVTDNPNDSVDGQWYLVFENWGTDAVTFSGSYEVAIHGTRATGNRIQGKVGVDDNKQGRDGQDKDEAFNFDRLVTFGTMEIDADGPAQFVDVPLLDGNGDPVLDIDGNPIINQEPVLDPITGLQLGSQFLPETIQVVVDDPNDSVHYVDNYYETVEESTGEIFRYAVVDQFEYSALAELRRGEIWGGGLGTNQFDDNTFERDAFLLEMESLGIDVELFDNEEIASWYLEFGLELGLEADPFVDPDPLAIPELNSLDIAAWEAELWALIREDIINAETNKPILDFGATDTASFRAAIDNAGNAATYQNFDFNQESFASDVIVEARQFVVQYDASGNVVSRTSTGVIDHFVTGADGNYWFDVAANPEPPVLEDFNTPEAFQAAYDQWFADFGSVFEYEISLSGDSAFESRIIDKDYSSVDLLDELDDTSDVSQYQTGEKKYNVTIFSSPQINDGQTTIVRDVNFLVEVDPAKTQATVEGSVYRDQDGDNIFDSTEEGVAGIVVFHDANMNGILDGSEVSSTVAADGSYSFIIGGLVSAQQAVIAIDSTTIPADLELRNPVTGTQTVTATPEETVQASFTLQRLGGEPALVQGFIFEDVNQNGLQDAGEVGLEATNSVRVYIDINNDGMYGDDGSGNLEPSSFTIDDGSFEIESEIEGQFNVRVDLSTTPLVLTLPSVNSILTDVSTTQVASGLIYGLFDPRNQDFGDLLGYPTLLAENGARHVVMDGVHLGSRVDTDLDGMPSVNARGDDQTGVNDEDGVVILGDIAADSTFDLDIFASGQGASLNAWIDFNNDGDWDDAGEQIFIDQTLILDQKNRFTLTAPTDVDPAATALAARFRWGPFGISYDGPANAGEVEDYLLPTTTPVNISGEVRNDTDGDGIFDTSDAPVENAIVYYDANLDGIRQDDEFSSFTNAKGQYQLAISTAVPLDITLRIDETSLQNGEEFVSPIDGIFSQTVTPGTPETANFLVGFPQGVQGEVFGDDDNNGAKGGAEVGLAGVTVNLYRDTDNDSVFETLVGTAVTDATGAYNIPVAIAEQYEVRLDLSNLEFHSQTTPNVADQVVTVSAGTIATAPDYGVYNATMDFVADFGDLSGVGFPTTAADNGASHLVVPGIFLGSTVDADPGTLTSSNANADDNSLADDEDGVVMVSDQILTDSTLEIDITATGTGVVMNAWIDFNNDGDWDDAGEQILLDRGLTSGVTTRVVIDTTGIEVAPSETELAARFRWGSAGVGYSGADTLGEVEDYLLATSTLPPSPADFTGDGTVDQADYDLWAATYGSTTNLAADGNNDGVVNAADYTVWRDALEAPAAAMAPVPPADETIFVTPVTFEPSAASASFAPVTVSPEESLELEASVLMGGSQDESFAIESAVAPEGPVQEGSVDEALLLIDSSVLSEGGEAEFATFESEEQEDEEALLEALSSF